MTKKLVYLFINHHELFHSDLEKRLQDDRFEFPVMFLKKVMKTHLHTHIGEFLDVLQECLPPTQKLQQGT